MNTAEWEERIAELQERGLEAWGERDAGGWRRVNNEAQALRETASEQAFAKIRLDDPEYVTRRLHGVLRAAREIERLLADFVPSAAEDVRAIQLSERDRLRAALQSKVLAPLEAIGTEVDSDGDVHAARRRVEAIGGELDRIDAATERLPTLGLVTER